MSTIEPMTDEQRKLVDDFARRWNPATIAILTWRGHWRAVMGIGFEKEDVEQELWVAICDAAKDFDSAQSSFVTYAKWRIRGCLSYMIARSMTKCRRPPGILLRGEDDVGGSGASPGSQLKRWDTIIRLDETTDEADRLNALKRYVAAAVDRLPPKQQRVVALRYGLDDDEPRTLAEVAETLGVTRQAAEQAEKRAFAVIGSALEGRCEDLVNFRIEQRDANATDSTQAGQQGVAPVEARRRRRVRHRVNTRRRPVPGCDGDQPVPREN